MSRLDPARIAGATPAERLASLRAATEGRIVFTTRARTVVEPRRLSTFTKSPS